MYGLLNQYCPLLLRAVLLTAVRIEQFSADENGHLAVSNPIIISFFPVVCVIKEFAAANPML